MRLTAHLLERSRFAHHPLDSDLAGKFLDSYLDALDGTHSLFLHWWRLHHLGRSTKRCSAAPHHAHALRHEVGSHRIFLPMSRDSARLHNVRGYRGNWYQ